MWFIIIGHRMILDWPVKASIGIWKVKVFSYITNIVCELWLNMNGSDSLEALLKRNSCYKTQRTWIFRFSFDGCNTILKNWNVTINRNLIISEDMKSQNYNTICMGITNRPWRDSTCWPKPTSSISYEAAWPCWTNINWSKPNSSNRNESGKTIWMGPNWSTWFCPENLFGPF